MVALYLIASIESRLDFWRMVGIWYADGDFRFEKLSSYQRICQSRHDTLFYLFYMERAATSSRIDKIVAPNGKRNVVNLE